VATVKGIDHISINTKDIQASIRFYADILEFRQMETVQMDGFRIVYFDVPRGGRLELFDYDGKNPQAKRGESEVGLRHLAFAVDDVKAAEEMLRKKGVTILLPATDLPAAGVKVVLFLDPNSVTLEFSQKLS
jgi:catechol 2,3-dioxygenase-like lactoylglutathione lyase family enzyme